MSIFKQDLKLNEMLTNSDFQLEMKNAINTYLLNQSDLVEYDDQWKQLFYQGTTPKQIEVFPNKAKYNIVYKAVSEGGQPQFATVKDAADSLLYIINYRAGIEFSHNVIKYNYKAQFEMILKELKEKGYEFNAQLHYNLIAASSSNNVAAAAPTPLAVGTAINAQVGAMKNTDKKVAQFVVCNTLDESLVNDAINPQVWAANLQRDLTVKTLNKATYALKVISTDMIPQGKSFIVEPKRKLISMTDEQQPGLVIDYESILSTKSHRAYADLYSGTVCTDSTAIRSVSGL